MNKVTIYDYIRLCKYYINDCRKCPLYLSSNGMYLDCNDLILNSTDKANEIILNWCKEHPVETRQDRFLKMFPNAQKLDSGILSICPKIVDATLTSDINCSGRPCKGCYKGYWLAEVEENE